MSTSGGTDVIAALALKANIASPTFTGEVIVPTDPNPTDAAQVQMVQAACPTGFSFATFDRGAGAGGAQIQPLTGNLHLTAVWLPAGFVVGHLAFKSGTIPANGPTHWWFGLYDLNAVQLAVTGDQLTTAWAATTTMSLAIAATAAGAQSTFTTTYSGVHYVGFMMTATVALVNLLGAAPQVNISLMPPSLGTGLSGSDTAQTTPPAFPHTAAFTSGNSISFAMVGV